MENHPRDEKTSMRAKLLEAALGTLEKNGWRIERIPRSGKSSLRRITKGDVTKKISIRTSQDTWVAFPRNANDDGWATLEDVDDVVVVSVNDRGAPSFAQVHLIPGDEMRKRFDRAYAARQKANHTMPIGRGIWLSMYEPESDSPTSLVGAGVGLVYPPIGRIPLLPMKADEPPSSMADNQRTSAKTEEPLTIAEAKRRLAASLGVSEADIKITISS